MSLTILRREQKKRGGGFIIKTKLIGSIRHKLQQRTELKGEETKQWQLSFVTMMMCVWVVKCFSLSRRWWWGGWELEHSPLSCCKYSRRSIDIVNTPTIPRTICCNAMNMDVILDKFTLTEYTGNSTAERAVTFVTNNDNMATDLTPDPAYNFMIRNPMLSCIGDIPIK
jgi:hypothetical protein